MRLTRIYVSQPLTAGMPLSLPEGQARHLVQVLRVEAGHPVAVFNGNGRDYGARVVQAGRDGVTLSIDSEGPEEAQAPLAIQLAIGVSKGERMDYAIQKAVELGVSAIQPLFTERSVVQLEGQRLDRRLDHWQGVVVGACEQCGRRRLPRLDQTVRIADWLVRAPSGGLMCDPDGTESLAALPAPTGGVVTLLVGPEGGLGDRERDLARRYGFKPVRLGPRILRTETVPIAAIAVLQALWGDLAG
jgi:16S rRNA (uracil1498-N3)-methyltransferase